MFSGSVAPRIAVPKRHCPPRRKRKLRAHHPLRSLRIQSPRKMLYSLRFLFRAVLHRSTVPFRSRKREREREREREGRHEVVCLYVPDASDRTRNHADQWRDKAEQIQRRERTILQRETSGKGRRSTSVGEKDARLLVAKELRR